MKVFIAILLAVESYLTYSLPFQKTDISILRRKTRSTNGHIGCMHMESMSGELQYTSDGTREVCGLYLIGTPDQIVEVKFTNFNVNCETDGLVAFFDGWELQGELFPDNYDHPKTLGERYLTFCGQQQPSELLISSQNVALIQFRVPDVGEGFKVVVNFKTNPQPCNAVAMFEMGVLTMKNYGERRNCTTSIIYPEEIKLLNVDVGVTAERKQPEAQIGLSDQQCMNIGGGDYVQLMNGNGLDTSLMATKGIYCGMETRTDKNVRVVLGCQHSVVRMVSSGHFYNTVTFQYSPPGEEELQGSGDLC